MSVPERLAAALADRYTLERELGHGGMATVYLAQDLKHDRKVAVKVLKPELAAVVGGDRFVTEIRTTANLQHPHILPLFDSGEADSFLYYVMPYVEGETLRDKLDREKQLSVAEAIAITVKIAGALQSAHEAGVIHRDVKPGNILLAGGEPLVADFGIALAVQQAGEGRITETGLSLGTPYYMAPEQATGDRDPDARSDLYSLACMLFEMLTGEPPFSGTTAQAVLGRILTQPAPDVTDIRSSVPPHIGAVLSRGLQKLPADRFDSVADFSRALQTDTYVDPTARASGAWAAAQGGGPAWKRRLPWGVAAVMALVAIGSLVLRGPSATPTATSTFTLDPRGWEFEELVRVEVSPDGRHFVTTATPEEDASSGEHVIIRRADEPDFRSLVGPGDFLHPVFSPDGTRVAYIDEDEAAIRVVPVVGGQSNPLFAEDGAAPSELAWGDDGFIYYWDDDIRRIPETGGAAETLLVDVPWAYEPTPLPGGRAILFTDSRGERSSVRILEIGEDSSRVLLPEAARPTWVSSGHLVYAHPDGGLQAVAFDLERLEVTGSPTPVREGISVDGSVTFYSLSREGTLVYTEGRSGLAFRAPSLLFELDLATGAEVRVPLEPRIIRGVRYSPDGTRIAFGAAAPGNGDNDDIQILTYDLGLGLTPTAWTPLGRNTDPAWSPDGQRLVYTAFSESEPPRIMLRDLTSEAPAEVVLAAQTGQFLIDPVWASDSTIVYTDRSGGTLDLWTAGMLDGPDPAPYLASEYQVFTPEISPSGDRIAYGNGDQYDESEVIVRSFPELGSPIRVSFGGGLWPRWHPDGGSLYFWRNLTGSPGGARTYALHRAFVSTTPVFRVDSTATVLESVELFEWDIHPDGTRMIFARLEESSDAQADDEPDVAERHIVVLNWFEELARRLPEGGR